MNQNSVKNSVTREKTKWTKICQKTNFTGKWYDHPARECIQRNNCPGFIEDKTYCYFCRVWALPED